VTRSYPLDELFCLIYLVLHADKPDPDFPQASEGQLNQLEHIKPLLFESFQVETSRDVTVLAERILTMLDEGYDDMFHDYLTFPVKQIDTFSNDTLFDELTRTDPLANSETEDVDEENHTVFDQPFSTWHRENENHDRKQNFLQFELDVGTKTSIL